ncbi:MAG: hypothetical protein U1E46_02465 [Hyphomicrobiales bacterium]
MRLSPSVSLAAALITVALSSQAFAADLPPPVPAAPEWQGSISIYGWLANVDGKFGVNGYGPVDINTSDSSSSVLADLQGVFMSSGELRYQNFGVFGDFIYVDLGQTDTSARGYANATANVSTIIGTAALTYAVVDTPTVTLEALAGARVWSVDGSLDLGLDILGANRSVSTGDTITWVDPLIGARGRYALSESWFLTGAAAIGGFGAGSEFMWDAAGTVGYAFTKNFAFQLGFRGLGVNYDRNGDVIDVTAWGPLAGLTLRF